MDVDTDLAVKRTVDPQPVVCEKPDRATSRFDGIQTFSRVSLAMNEHEASVLNKLTERAGPHWTLAAILVLRIGTVAVAVGGIAKIFGWV